MAAVEDFELEGNAARTYAAAGLDPRHPDGIIALARRTPGIVGVQLIPGLSVRARLVRLPDDTAEIHVRAGLDEVTTTWLIAHELGEFLWSRCRANDNAEQLADNQSAVLIAPGEGMRRAVLTHGFDLQFLAVIFGTTQTTVALRIGEACDVPIALVRPDRVVLRGPWADVPSDAAVRAIVLAGGVPGARVIRLTDERQRFVIVFE